MVGKSWQAQRGKSLRVCKPWKSILLVPIEACCRLVSRTQYSHQVGSPGPRVCDFLDKRLYSEGAIVKEGQVLFLMRMRPFQVQVEGAKAAIAMQKAVFETARMNLARPAPILWRICEAMEFLGIRLSQDRNDPIGNPVTIRVMRTNEELMIARHTCKLLVKESTDERDRGF